MGRLHSSLVATLVALALASPIPAAEILEATGRVVLDGVMLSDGRGPVDLWEVDVRYGSADDGRAVVLGAFESRAGITLAEPVLDARVRSYVVAPHAEVGEASWHAAALVESRERLRCPCKLLEEVQRWAWTREASEGTGQPGGQAWVGTMRIAGGEGRVFPVELDVPGLRTRGSLTFPPGDALKYRSGRLARLRLEGAPPEGGATLLLRDPYARVIGTLSSVPGERRWGDAVLVAESWDQEVFVDLLLHIPQSVQSHDPASHSGAATGGLFGQGD